MKEVSIVLAQGVESPEVKEPPLPLGMAVLFARLSRKPQPARCLR